MLGSHAVFHPMIRTSTLIRFLLSVSNSRTTMDHGFGHPGAGGMIWPHKVGGLKSIELL